MVLGNGDQQDVLTINEHGWSSETRWIELRLLLTDELHRRTSEVHKLRAHRQAEGSLSTFNKSSLILEFIVSS
jgi:hypothetical protein